MFGSYVAEVTLFSLPVPSENFALVLENLIRSLWARLEEFREHPPLKALAQLDPWDFIVTEMDAMTVSPRAERLEVGGQQNEKPRTKKRQKTEQF